MEKYRNLEIKPFSFVDLKGNHPVEKNQAKTFEFKSFPESKEKPTPVAQEQIKAERIHAKKNRFEVDHLVVESRGYLIQEGRELEDKIQKEVSRRLEKIHEEAFEKGFEQGKNEARDQIQDQLKLEANEIINDFSKRLADLNDDFSKQFEKNRLDILEFIKRFTKWIVLKEIDENKYLDALLEKLIIEINSKKNIILKVGKNHQELMPQIIEDVQNRIGQISNLRIEVVPEINYPGLIIESENGLVDGTLETIFQKIDTIFDQVKNNEQSRT